MGKLYGSEGAAQATPNVIANKYLNLEGLQSFWTKAKQYITASQEAQTKDITNAYIADDNAIKQVVGAIKVNNKLIATYTNVDDVDGTAKDTLVANQIVLGAEDIDLAVALDAGSCVRVNPSAAEVKYDAASTVEAGLHQLDTRVDAVETAFSQGVVNNLTTSAEHAKYGETDNYAWVTITENAKATGEVSVKVNDEAITAKMANIDREILDLHANAGVVGIAVVDTPAGESDKDNYVKFTMKKTSVDGGEGVKANNPDGLSGDYYKGFIELTVDESALDTKIQTITDDLSDEVADRKADVVLLAGDRGSIGADGTLVWDESKFTGTVKYNNISAIANRLETIDSSVVTKVTVVDDPGAASEDPDKDLIKFSSSAADNGTGDIVLTLDHKALSQRMIGLDGEDAKFAKYSVQGKSLYSAAEDGGLKNITLYGNEILRNTNGGAVSIDANFTALESKISALASATTFAGVVTFDPATTTPVAAGEDAAGVPMWKVGEAIFQSGDIVIYGQKEYVLDGTLESGTKAAFVELGDTTAEQAQLTEIQAWINNPISEADIEDLFKA